MGLSIERERINAPRKILRSGLLAFLIFTGPALPETVMAGFVMQDNDCPLPLAPSNFRVEEWIDRSDGINKEVVIKWDAQAGDIGYWFELNDFRTRGIDITIPNHPHNSIFTLLKGDTTYGASVFAQNSCGWGPEATLAVTYYRTSEIH